MMIIPKPIRYFYCLSPTLSGPVRDKSVISLDLSITFNNTSNNNTDHGHSLMASSTNSIPSYYLDLLKISLKWRRKCHLFQETLNKPNYFSSLSGFSKMSKCFAAISFIMILCSTLIISNPESALAQQHSYDPHTDNDDGQQFGDCLKDINKYCRAWAPLLFELENCLQSHIAHLTPACRSHMENTDFRKYHSKKWLSPDVQVSGISRKSGTNS